MNGILRHGRYSISPTNWLHETMLLPCRVQTLDSAFCEGGQGDLFIVVDRAPGWSLMVRIGS